MVAPPELSSLFTSPILAWFATQGIYPDEAEISADWGFCNFHQLQVSLHATALSFLKCFDW